MSRGRQRSIADQGDLQPCDECGSTADLTDFGDIGPGRRWRLCAACLRRFTEEAARREAISRGHSADAFTQAADRVKGQPDGAAPAVADRL